jgi:hypothetical protein
MTVYIISGIVVSGLVLVLFLLLSARSEASARYRAELEDLRSAKRRAEQAAVKAQMGERAVVAELRHLRAQQQGRQEFMVAAPQASVAPVAHHFEAPGQRPASTVRAPAPVGRSSRGAQVRHSGAPVTSADDTMSPVTAALLVHTMAATHSYGDYSDVYNDSCSSSSYSDSCSGGGDYGGGGCDSGGCGGD